MNDYQAFAAKEAEHLLTLMEQVAKQDPGVEKLLNAMRPDVEKLIHGLEPLPSRVLDGWSYYFSPDGPHNIFDGHRELAQAEADLAFAVRRGSFEAYDAAVRMFESFR
ncbi:hypothetical protein SNE35_12645 [Paucibacter sp. R3-3]|uniref:Uncharacterized protein n=1 Tax=Roseateles agri TaxID=3098619 RepID=A0ABU5DJS9_9BURK|nr:hypothetical protein [Paucibacter sp. R3-3]MDY0745362.1 hypothetical protein [Paucibacter sp. R3-3]